MKNRIIPIRTHGLALALSLLSTTAFAQASTPSPSEQDLEIWRQTLNQAPQPATGSCLTATYPSTQWQVTPCGQPAAPASQLEPTITSGIVLDIMVVPGGTGRDYVAVANGGKISSAEGSFPSVMGANNVSSVGVNPISFHDIAERNDRVFTLQLNTNQFDISSTGLCGSAPCQGREHFIYKLRDNGSADIFVQYWLWYEDNDHSCPTKPVIHGTTPWRFYQEMQGQKNTMNICYGYANGPTLTIPVKPEFGVSDILKNTKVHALTENSQDGIILHQGIHSYALHKYSIPFGKLLSQNWSDARFNIFGASEAYYNATFYDKTILTIKTIVNNGTSNPPLCRKENDSHYGNGYHRGNNLELLGPCSATGGTTPSITFVESNPADYIITPRAGTGGTISPATSIAVSSESGAEYLATPDPGYYVSSVRGCGMELNGNSDSPRPLAFVVTGVTSNCTVTTVFAKIPPDINNEHTITISVGAGGTVSPSGSIKLPAIASQVLTITPNSGYYIFSFSGCGTLYLGNNQDTSSRVISTRTDSNCTFSAKFSAVTNYYTVTTDAGAGGRIRPVISIVPSTSSRNRVFTVKPYSGYYISSIGGCGGTVFSGNANDTMARQYTTGAINGNCTITAAFTKTPDNRPALMH